MRCLPSFRSVALATLGILASGCSSAKPDLGAIYDRAARSHHANPVVVIPGVLGSRLVDADGAVVWGAFGGRSADPSEPVGARRFALPMAPGRDLEELTDGVRPDGALDRLDVSLLGLHVFLDAYKTILTTLGVGGYRDRDLGELGVIDYGDDHYTCFQFDYDWRRDLFESARLFGEFLEATRREVAAQRGVEPETVRFDVVAHSMGGLLLRTFLRTGGAIPGPEEDLPWVGAPLVERAVLVGTPNAGSARALLDLVEGRDFGLFGPSYPPAFIGTFPSVYQLLPRARHGVLTDGANLLDPELWERRGWGLADPASDERLAWLLPGASAEVRRRTALDHLHKCLERARALHAVLDTPSSPPEGTELFLVAGDAVGTLQSVAWDLDRRRLRPNSWAAGDGTVLRSSALGDERRPETWRPHLVSPVDWSGVHFLFRDHLGLTQDEAFTDNVLYLLLEDPR